MVRNEIYQATVISIYLNRVYLGSGMSASLEKYFNKKVEELNLYECALIASLLKAPSKYNPISNENFQESGHQKFWKIWLKIN